MSNNFDNIKKEMEEARQKAEDKKKAEEFTVNELTDDSIDIEDDSDVREVQLTIKPAITKKPRKRAVNYYLSVPLIQEIERKAKKFNKKGSHLVEELLSQILYNI